jgi:hypothetical protein
LNMKFGTGTRAASLFGSGCIKIMQFWLYWYTLQKES